MLTSVELLRKNPHCLQSLRQGGEHDPVLSESELFDSRRETPRSEHRFSRVDIPFESEVWMGSGNVPENTYVEMKKLKASVHHWGQLKLLLNEIDFLTPYIHLPELCVVYVGASPGHHLKVLVDMMPKTWTWELFDEKPNEVFAGDGFRSLVVEKQVSNKYINDQCEKGLYYLLDEKQAVLNTRRAELAQLIEKLEESDAPAQLVEPNKRLLWQLQHTALVLTEHRPNVIVHTCNMDTAKARQVRMKYVKRTQTASDPQLLCISDIRTPSQHINEASVQRDMEIQHALVQQLKPFQASLKFRLPYSEKFPDTQTYLDGRLLYQPFSPKVSHECRLHTWCGQLAESLIDYSCDEYARRMFHFQTVLRTSLYEQEAPLPNAADHPSLALNGVGTDHCYDCTAARKIIEAYAAKAGKMDTLKTLDDIVRELVAVQRVCKADTNLEDE